MAFRIGRLELRRSFEGAQRVGVTALFLQHYTEIGIRPGIVRRQRHDALERRFGLAELAAIFVDIAEIEMGGGVIRADRYRLAEKLDRLAVTAALIIENAEQIERDEISRVRFENAPVQPFGFFQAPAW